MGRVEELKLRRVSIMAQMTPLHIWCMFNRCELRKVLLSALKSGSETSHCSPIER
jgi:hypothetical protein